MCRVSCWLRTRAPFWPNVPHGRAHGGRPGTRRAVGDAAGGRARSRRPPKSTGGRTVTLRPHDSFSVSNGLQERARRVTSACVGLSHGCSAPARPPVPSPDSTNGVRRPRQPSERVGPARGPARTLLGDRPPFSARLFIIPALRRFSFICVEIELHRVPHAPAARAARVGDLRAHEIIATSSAPPGQRRPRTAHYLPIVISRKQLNKNTRRGTSPSRGIPDVSDVAASLRTCAVRGLGDGLATCVTDSPQDGAWKEAPGRSASRLRPERRALCPPETPRASRRPLWALRSLPPVNPTSPWSARPSDRTVKTILHRSVSLMASPGVGIAPIVHI